MKFVVATGNEGKLKEFRHILKDIAEVVSAKELGIVDFPPEDGNTYEANALIKAHFVSQTANLPAIADDSGIEVDALGGEPGIYSARYGNKNSDAERREYMLEQLQHAPQPPAPNSRKARFCSAIAFTLPDKQSFTFFATTEGEITTEARGDSGFGYDPIFLSDDLGKTFAEASQDEKKSVSHRGRALEKFLAWLESPEAKQAFMDNTL